MTKSYSSPSSLAILSNLKLREMIPFFRNSQISKFQSGFHCAHGIDEAGYRGTRLKKKKKKRRVGLIDELKA